MSGQLDVSQFGHGRCSQCGGTLWSHERVQGNTVCGPCRKKALPTSTTLVNGVPVEMGYNRRQWFDGALVGHTPSEAEE